MDAKHFDAWTRRYFGLAAGSAVAAPFACRNQAPGEPDRGGATHQRCPADALDCVAGAQLTPDMRPPHRTPWKEPLMSHRSFPSRRRSP